MTANQLHHCEFEWHLAASQLHLRAAAVHLLAIKHTSERAFAMHMSTA